MSSNVFPVKPARSACHVPENVLPAPAKYPASAGPSAWPAHSPSGQTMCLREQCGWSRQEASMSRWRASGASISAHHLPRKVPLAPAVAPHTPRSTGRDSCASAQETSRTLKTRTRRFIGTGIVPRIRIRKRRRAFTRICHSEGANHSSRQVECAC